MHNWRLLILAILAVLQPIASFTEHNLVDGREQCCGRHSVLRDTRLSHGFRFNKLPQEYRLSRAASREDRRYEVRRENTVLDRASADRRLVKLPSLRDESRFSLETSAPNVRAEFRRETVDNRRNRLSTLQEDRDRHVRDAFRTSARDVNRNLQREQDVSHIRHSQESNVRQHDRNVRELSRTRATYDTSRLSRNMHNEQRFRVSMASRWNRDNSEERRVQERREAREILQRARTNVAQRKVLGGGWDRRIVRERADERRERAEYRLERDNNRVRRSLDRRVRDVVDERRSISVDHVRDLREESHRHTSGERRLGSRREVVQRIDERRLQRDERRASSDRITYARSTLRDRTVEDRREADRSRRVERRTVRIERAEIRDSKFDQRRAPVNKREERAESQRVDSRNTRNREASGIVTERRERQITERRDIRDSRREARMERNVNARQWKDSRTHAEYRDARNLDLVARYKSSPESFRSRELFTSMREKTELESRPAVNWQFLFYTLQGIYLCGVLMQVLSQNESKKPRGLFWLTAPRSLIKVD